MLEKVITHLKIKHDMDKIYLEYIANNPKAALPNFPEEVLGSDLNELSLAIKILEAYSEGTNKG